MILAFLSGLIGVFAFAPYYLYPLAVLSLMGLLLVWRKANNPKQAFLTGLAFGIGYFGLGVHWVFISIYEFGHAPMALSIFLTTLLVLVLALFPALVGYCWARCYPERSWRSYLLAFPAIWCLGEWIRSWVFTGFPWLLMGDSQTNGLFLGAASIGGTLLISFLLAQIAGICVYAWQEKRYHWPMLYLICLGALLYASCQITWTRPIEAPITASLVQGNIEQSLKWEENKSDGIYQTYRDLTLPVWNSDLIIWPEAAIPVPIPYANPWITALDEEAKIHHTTLLFGIPIRDDNAIYNGIQAVGNSHGQYRKRHLVPFGEFFPIPRLTAPILQQLDIPMANFQAGPPQQKNIKLGKLFIANYICYEMAFASEVRATLGNASLMVAISDDAWFGHSNAQAQQLQMAQMRAMENRRPLLSTTNNGLTAIINAEGQITRQLKPFTSGVLTAKIQALEGQTFWSKHGMDLVLLLSITGLIIGRSSA